MRSPVMPFALVVLLAGNLFAEPYWGAELRTHESFQYGRFETRLKAVQGAGYLCSFFTYNDSFPASEWAEIDFEILGRWSDNIDMNVIDEHGSHLRQNPVPINVHDGFHTYAFEWTPEYVAWFLDGEELWRQSGEHIQDLYQPGKLMMNIWTPAYTDWVGVIDPRTLPRYASYDWVSVADFTPGSGNVGSDQNFTLRWTDGFNAFNDSLWEKSDGHSWNGNNALLKADNIVYQDGMMHLCLTLEGELGIQPDSQAPIALWARAESLDSVVVSFSEPLDTVTAENPSVFALPGAEILSATLLDGGYQVGLKLAANLSSATSVYALGLKDLAHPPNTQMGSGVSIEMPAPLDLPIRIDVGGNGLQGFLPDQVWNHTTEYGREGGNPQLNTQYPDMESTALDSVLASSLNRWSRYHVRLLPGIYDIELSFVDHYYTQAGERVFQLFVEDSLIAEALDVVWLAGPEALLTITLQDWVIDDGRLDLLGAALEYGETYAYAGPLLNAVHIDGERFVATDVPLNIPSEVQLSPAFPNPFNPETSLHFTLPEMQQVHVQVFNLSGQEVLAQPPKTEPAGRHDLHLDMSGFSSGVYLLRLTAGSVQQHQKLLLLK